MFGFFVTRFLDPRMQLDSSTGMEKYNAQYHQGEQELIKADQQNLTVYWEGTH